jgi:hypothetical protein
MGSHFNGKKREIIKSWENDAGVKCRRRCTAFMPITALTFSSNFTVYIEKTEKFFPLLLFVSFLAQILMKLNLCHNLCEKIFLSMML